MSLATPSPSSAINVWVTSNEIFMTVSPWEIITISIMPVMGKWSLGNVCFFTVQWKFSLRASVNKEVWSSQSSTWHGSQLHNVKVHEDLPGWGSFSVNRMLLTVSESFRTVSRSSITLESCARLAFWGMYLWHWLNRERKMSLASMFMIFFWIQCYFSWGYNNRCVTKNTERERLVKFSKKPEECLANPELINETFSPPNGKCCVSGYFSTTG